MGANANKKQPRDNQDCFDFGTKILYWSATEWHSNIKRY